MPERGSTRRSRALPACDLHEVSAASGGSRRALSRDRPLVAVVSRSAATRSSGDSQHPRRASPRGGSRLRAPSPTGANPSWPSPAGSSARISTSLARKLMATPRPLSRTAGASGLSTPVSRAKIVATARDAEVPSSGWARKSRSERVFLSVRRPRNHARSSRFALFTSFLPVLPSTLGQTIRRVIRLPYRCGRATGRSWSGKEGRHDAL